MCWLLASLTEAIHTQVIGCNSSHAIWTSLEWLYSTTSTACIMQLQLQLQQTKRGASTIHEYLLKIKTITDQLAIARCPVSDEDLCLHIMNGLGSDYAAFVTSISTRDIPITFHDLHDMLLTQELHLKDDVLHLHGTSPIANVACTETQGNKSNNRGNVYFRGCYGGRSDGRSRG
ncbi:uncharacterized protein LOC122084961 [Macadamia integrifolia]|uniref:uncharacterized protein LOC122084961 n=1 Tax=Macadamia integrifolia TaxID=60698 RepID=UPI001C4FDCBB|nr:uncharacterized protein LOC122084961 [Macadamia integrifolia]